jgi:hypothetical protein
VEGLEVFDWSPQLERSAVYCALEAETSTQYVKDGSPSRPDSHVGLGKRVAYPGRSGLEHDWNLLFIDGECHGPSQKPPAHQVIGVREFFSERGERRLDEGPGRWFSF